MQHFVWESPDVGFKFQTKRKLFFKVIQLFKSSVRVTIYQLMHGNILKLYICQTQKGPTPGFSICVRSFVSPVVCPVNRPVVRPVVCLVVRPVVCLH